MNKLKITTSALLLFALYLMPSSMNAQQVILINGQPASVILSGDEIKSLVSHKLSGYMKSYGQSDSDEFVKGLVKFPNETEGQEKKKESSVILTDKAPVDSKENQYVAAVPESKKRK